MRLLNIIRTLRPASTGVTPRLPDTLHALIRRLGLSVTRPTSRSKRGGFRKQRVTQIRITHRFDVVPRAVKAASANVSQLINLRVIQHRERDIPLTIIYYIVLGPNARPVKNKALSVADVVICGGGVAVLYTCGLTINQDLGFYTEWHVHTFRTYGLYGHFQ